MTSPRRPGCLLFTATLLLSITLASIAMLLPPFSLPERLAALAYTPLSPAGPSFHAADFSIHLPGDSAATNFGIRVSPTDWDAANQPDHIQSALDSLPPQLAPHGPLYVLHAHGETPDRLNFDFAAPANVPSVEALSLYAWDGDSWRFVPATYGARMQGEADFLPQAIALFQTIAAPPIVLLAQELDHAFDVDLARHAAIVSPAGLRPRLDGSLTGSLAPGSGGGAEYLYMPLIRSFSQPGVMDTETVSRVIAEPQRREAHIRHIVELAANNDFDGVVIDYRDLPADLRDAYSQFARDLAAAMQARDMRLGIVIQADSAAETAYDWSAVGAAADYFILDISEFFDPALVHDSLLRVVERVDRYKVLLKVSARSLLHGAGGSTAIGIDDAFAGLGAARLHAATVSETGSVAPGEPLRASLDGFEARVDADHAARTLAYFDAAGGQIARISLADEAALRQRIAPVWTFALGGVAFDDSLSDDLYPGVAAALLDDLTQLPMPGDHELALRWTVAAGDEALVENVTGLNESFDLTLVAPDGDYAVNAAVIDSDGSRLSGLKGAALPLYQPTPTPTPTPLPTPTFAPAPAVFAPVAAADESPPASFAAVPPPPGSISIEIGGHVTSAGSQRAIDAMRRAGMSWLKIQARFDWRSPPDISGEINRAHSSGFKILVGTVGRANELGQGGRSFVEGYTDWLARIAGQGADAIEVWNEPNLDREWPRGKISGADYADMLRLAYTKIKRVNPNVLVISAAPAPTGVSDIPDRVMPDNTWLRQMVEAGGLDYLDCVGAHYNEGIIPPGQQSGDPRDTYYTRYFYGMLTGYISITRRPICFTELGYVSSEGYPPLSSSFAWAANVTVAQQAAWLAEAAALASSSGQVRLLIVWNIDFTRYDNDPQAGYAIIRRDGSCPACDALARAR